MIPDTRLDHLFLLAPPWGPIEHRPHHLVRAIMRATGCRVLYVEDTNRGALSVLAEPWSLLRVVEPGLFAMKRFKVFPYESKSQLASRMNRKVMALAIRLVSRIIGLRNVVQWHWTAYTHDYVGMTGEGLVVYDGACETSLYSWATPTIRSNERDLLRRADLAFAATDVLREMSLVDNPHTFVIANAVDSSWLKREKASSKEAPSEIAKLNHPILGFVGNIHEWIDGSLIEGVATMRPSWQIVLIGPIRNPTETEKEIQKIRGLANVHVLGPKAYGVLQDYSAAFDVCIIPYKLTKLTTTAETLKFYEYLASGKPIVSTPLPMLRKWSEVVVLAGTPEEFVVAVEHALNEEKVRASRRLELARTNTWDDRAALAAKLIGEAWARKHGASARDSPAKP